MGDKWRNTGTNCTGNIRQADRIRYSSAMTMQQYLRHKRFYEIAMWSAFACINYLANVAVIWIEMGYPQPHAEFAYWEPAVWEGTSALAMFPLLLWILWIDRYFPIRRPHMFRHAGMHLLATIPFSLLHVAGMVALREAIYAWTGGDYQFGELGWELLYEYLKDFRSYANFVAIIYLYRFTLRRLQGEAEFVSEGREDQPQTPVRDRFLVKKFGKEFLVKVEDIEWISANGNYVDLHVDNRLYPLRQTMTVIAKQLNAFGFQRIHRSTIVNLDAIVQIVPTDSGEAQISTKSGATLGVSRHYRKQLKLQLDA